MEKLNTSIKYNYTAFIARIYSTNVNVNNKCIIYYFDPIENSNYSDPEEYFTKVIKLGEDQDIELVNIFTSSSKFDVVTAVRKFVSEQELDVLFTKPSNKKINLKPFMENRKVFAELRSKCKTSHQMKAFNEFVKSFSDKERWIVATYKGKHGGEVMVETSYKKLPGNISDNEAKEWFRTHNFVDDPVVKHKIVYSEDEAIELMNKWD